MAPNKTVLVTGANGYIGNAVARAFVRAGWTTYGLIRSTRSATAVAAEEIIPVIGSIDDVGSHGKILEELPATIDVVVSVTEVIMQYVPHYRNIVSLLRSVAGKSTANGVRPLVIFTSGCKDYGVGAPHGNPDLVCHTEESPLNPPVWARDRATYALKIFDNDDAFSAVVTRPTNVYGRSSSVYIAFFEVAASAAESGKPLLLPSDPNTICSAVHVDDCADAYVAIASHPDRTQVEGQCFNISAHRYEVLDELAQTLAREYKIENGLKYVSEAELGPSENPWPPFIIDFPQWTGSEKLRKLTGWANKRPLFSEALHTYRLAFDAASQLGHENVARVKMTLDGLGSSKKSNS